MENLSQNVFITEKANQHEPKMVSKCLQEEEEATWYSYNLWFGSAKFFVFGVGVGVGVGVGAGVGVGVGAGSGVLSFNLD